MVMVWIRVLLDLLPRCVSLLIIEVFLLPSQVQHLLAEHVSSLFVTFFNYTVNELASYILG